MPKYSPNLNLIERLWGFMRREALSRWHKTFAEMQESVTEVLDHLENFREEIRSLMNEEFQIIEKEVVAPETVPAE